MSADVKALIAEARNRAEDMPTGELPKVLEIESMVARNVAGLLVCMADALEALSASPLVADQEEFENALGVALANAYDDDSVVTVEEAVTRALFASGVIRKAEPLVADEEAVAKVLASSAVLHSARGAEWERPTYVEAQRMVNALFASGVIERRGDVQAEALEAAADRIQDKRALIVNNPTAKSNRSFYADWLRARVAALRTAEKTPVAPHDHRPVQHRDGKPPWCRLCGLDAQFNEPKTRLGRTPEEGKP